MSKIKEAQYFNHESRFDLKRPPLNKSVSLIPSSVLLNATSRTNIRRLRNETFCGGNGNSHVRHDVMNEALPSTSASESEQRESTQENRNNSKTNKQNIVYYKKLNLDDVKKMDLKKEKEISKHYKKNSFYSLHMLLRYKSEQLTGSYKPSNHQPNKVVNETNKIIELDKMRKHMPTRNTKRSRKSN